MIIVVFVNNQLPVSLQDQHGSAENFHALDTLQTELSHAAHMDPREHLGMVSSLSGTLTHQLLVVLFRSPPLPEK